jgi:hypothetical protein
MLTIVLLQQLKDPRIIWFPVWTLYVPCFSSVQCFLFPLSEIRILHSTPFGTRSVCKSLLRRTYTCMSSLIEICLVATKAGHTQCNVVTRDEHRHWDQHIMRAVICWEKGTVVTRIHSSALKNDVIVPHLIANVSDTNYLEWFDIMNMTKAKLTWWLIRDFQNTGYHYLHSW